MERKYSDVVDPSLYDTDGLFEGIPVLVHRNQDLADRGCLRAQKDWKRQFGTLDPGFAGSMGPEYNFVSTWFCETLPDRIELVGYIHEMAFLFDDMVDAAESPAAVFAPIMAELVQVYRVVMEGGDIDNLNLSGSPISRIVVDTTKAMLAVDPEQTKTGYRHLERWGHAFLARASNPNLQDFDEYLEYRLVNVSSGAVFGFLTFAMGLSIPEDQQQICLELARPAWLQIALANDCHSWDREYKRAKHNNQSTITNAIWVLTEKHSMTLEEAKSVCRGRARKFAAEYLDLLKSDKVQSLCSSARTLLDALKYAMSGNVVWGLQSPRYHPGQSLNTAQLEMAKTISEDETVGWYPEVTSKASDAGHGPSGAHGAVATMLQEHVTVLQEIPLLGCETLEAPSRYLDSLPSKGIRDKAIDALNVWFKVPSETASIIKRIVALLHGASLLLDDIQDLSQLRRGKPAAHLVFGLSPTINAAGYRFLQALVEVRKLNEGCLDIFCDELRDLYVGQSHDLTWTRNLECPAEKEYLEMVDKKTGGLFRMLARMLDAMSNSPTKPDVSLLARFMTLLGRLFQIRDDYMNLTSADYTKQKGFCEDLDEGKYSLPLIHALGSSGTLGAARNGFNNAGVIRSLLSQRHSGGTLSLDQKKLLLQQIKDAGSLEYTRQALDALQKELKNMATQMGMYEDANLRVLLEVLKV